MAERDIDTKRFAFLSKLIKMGNMTVGENMYLIGQQLGFDRELVDNIIKYYSDQQVIEFPVLGPYIRLVKDWYNVLNEQDRIRLKEGFLLTLDELTNKTVLIEFDPREVFEELGFHAYSETLVPMIVESLNVEGQIKKENNRIIITTEGKDRCNELRQRNRRLHQETLKRLGVI